jgi:hypothetical protein
MGTTFREGRISISQKRIQADGKSIKLTQKRLRIPIILKNQKTDRKNYDTSSSIIADG